MAPDSSLPISTLNHISEPACVNPSLLVHLENFPPSRPLWRFFWPKIYFSSHPYIFLCSCSRCCWCLTHSSWDYPRSHLEVPLTIPAHLYGFISPVSVSPDWRAFSEHRSGQKGQGVNAQKQPLTTEEQEYTDKHLSFLTLPWDNSEACSLLSFRGFLVGLSHHCPQPLPAYWYDLDWLFFLLHFTFSLPHCACGSARKLVNSTHILITRSTSWENPNSDSPLSCDCSVLYLLFLWVSDSSSEGKHYLLFVLIYPPVPSNRETLCKCCWSELKGKQTVRLERPPAEDLEGWIRGHRDEEKAFA